MSAGLTGFSPPLFFFFFFFFLSKRLMLSCVNKSPKGEAFFLPSSSGLRLSGLTPFLFNAITSNACAAVRVTVLTGALRSVE